MICGNLRDDSMPGYGHPCCPILKYPYDMNVPDVISSEFRGSVTFYHPGTVVVLASLATIYLMGCYAACRGVQFANINGLLHFQIADNWRYRFTWWGRGGGFGPGIRPLNS